MQITPVQIIVVLVSGIVAGFINTMAGGGSFLTLVALDFAGLPTAVANGTNRVAVEVGAILSVLGFRSKGASKFRQGLHFAIPTLLGSIVGSLIASRMSPTLFKRVVAVAMLLMLFNLIFDSKRWLKNRTIEMTPLRRVAIYVVFFFIGVYGGAIQAGVGFIFIAVLVLLAGQDLVSTSFFKVFCVSIYTLVALLVFALNGQVNWALGAILAVGNGTGGWLASRLAVDKGDRLVRGVLIVMLLVMSIRYLGIIPGF